MTRLLSILLLIVFGSLSGCNNSSSQPTHTAASTEKSADVHIRTPGANVDVERRSGKGVNVEVQKNR